MSERRCQDDTAKKWYCEMVLARSIPDTALRLISVCLVRAAAKAGFDATGHFPAEIPAGIITRRSKKVWCVVDFENFKLQGTDGRPRTADVMDPLSLTASIITVVGAASQTSKALQYLYNLKNAPKEFLEFKNEVLEQS